MFLSNLKFNPEYFLCVMGARGPFCYHESTLIPVIRSNIKCCMKCFIHSQTSTVQPLRFGNEQVISSHTLLDDLQITSNGDNAVFCLAIDQDYYYKTRLCGPSHKSIYSPQFKQNKHELFRFYYKNNLFTAIYMIYTIYK